MPLSLTFTASFGSFSARRNDVSTSVTNEPRLRLFMPQRSGSVSTYSSSLSECISRSTSMPNSCALRISRRHSSLVRQAAMSSTAEAPHSEAAYICASSMTKFLYSTGIVTPLSRAVVIKASQPPKYFSSVSMERAAAPLFW